MRYVLLFIDVDYMDTYYIYMYVCMYVCVITASDRAETHGFSPHECMGFFPGDGGLSHLLNEAKPFIAGLSSYFTVL